MKLMKNLFVFLIMLGIYTPSYAVLTDLGSANCAVFNEDNGKDGDKKEGEEEEEPDCE
jgi:hypothetical protein